MYKAAGLVCLLALASAPGFAGGIPASLYQGTFTDDSDFVLIPFSLSANDTVTVESYGYAGGTTPESVVITEGGFAPNVILFDGSGNEILSDNGGHCATTGNDSVTNNCDDPYFQEALDAGSYTLALVEWDNTSVDGSPADGFVQTGNPGFTCAELGLTGNFCDVTTALGTQRDGDYAVEISAPDLVLAPTPEPSTICLLTMAGALTIACLRCKAAHSGRN